MGDTGGLPPLPDIFPPDTFADETPPPPILQVSTQCVGGPANPINVQNQTITDTARAVGAWLCSIGAPFWMQTLVAGIAYAIPTLFSLILQIGARLIAPVLALLVAPVMQALGTLRKSLDPAAASIATDVLGELLGTEYTSVNIQDGSDIASHLANAQTIGTLLHKQLSGEFAGGAGITPASGQIAAERFTGLVINFGTATGILGLLGGMCPWLHLDEVREVGEEVAKSLGLGRMHRRAIQPLIDIFISNPYKWFLNSTYHPSQFTLQEVVNAYAQTVMSLPVVQQAGLYAGYTTAQINELIALHEKRLNLTDVDRLMRWKIWTADQGTQYAQTLGYDPAILAAAFQNESATRADKWLSTFVTQMETEFSTGQIDEPTFTAFLQGLPIDPNEYNVILSTALAKLAHKVGKVKQSPRAVYEYAFEHDLIDLDELQAFYESEGLNPVDVQLMLQVQLFKLGKLEAAAAAKAAKAAAKANAAAATTAAAASTPTPPVTVTPPKTA